MIKHASKGNAKILACLRTAAAMLTAKHQITEPYASAKRVTRVTPTICASPTNVLWILIVQTHWHVDGRNALILAIALKMLIALGGTIGESAHAERATLVIPTSEDAPRVS